MSTDTYDYFDLVHNFIEIDEWDGSGCPDYCSGCHSCDHFPPTISVRCPTTTEYHVRLHLCDICFYNSSRYSCAEKPQKEQPLTTLQLIRSDETDHCDHCDSHEYKLYYLSIARGKCLMCHECSVKWQSMNNTTVVSKEYVHFRKVRDIRCAFCDSIVELIYGGSMPCV